MKRREFVTSVLATGLAAPALAGNHQHGVVKGPLASATVSFGHWMQFDRLGGAGGPNDRFQNGHALIPHEVRVKQGGTVNFIVAGFHNVVVYGPGTKPTDINIGMTIQVGAPPGPPLINDPTNRVFRGVDPSLNPQDRVEVVVFPNRGRHLVICGVLPHFATDNMFGYVNVVPGGDDDDD